MNSSEILLNMCISDKIIMEIEVVLRVKTGLCELFCKIMSFNVTHAPNMWKMFYFVQRIHFLQL